MSSPFNGRCGPDSEELARDWRKSARFYARHGVTESLFQRGVPSSAVVAEGINVEEVSACSDWTVELWERVRAVFQAQQAPTPDGLWNGPSLPLDTLKFSTDH